MQSNSVPPNLPWDIQRRPFQRIHAQAASIASSIVIYPFSDDMADLLRGLGIPFTKSMTLAFFKTDLLSAKIAFIDSYLVEGQTFEDLRSFVGRGGTIFVGDQASHLLTELKLAGLSFYPGYGVRQIINAQLIDPELRAVLRQIYIPINFPIPGWAPVKSLPSRTTVLLRGDAEFGIRPRRHTLRKQPLVLSFPVGAGFVLCANWRYDDSFAPFTEIERAFLSSLVIKAIATATGRTLQQVIAESSASYRSGLSRQIGPSGIQSPFGM